jgi:predicted DsbA family dithiol-disulfide isomerase
LNKDLVTKRGLELGIHLYVSFAFHTTATKLNITRFSQFKGKIRQTTRAHRLLYLAYHRGGSKLQQQMLEELFQSYWVRGLDIGSIPFLACVASRLGLMPYNTAVMWLESNAGEAEVKRLAAISNECGIQACPFTVIEGKWAICGGEYREVLSQVRP